IRIAPILWLVCLLAITHSVTAALRLYWRILKRQTKSRSQSRQVVFSDLKARLFSSGAGSKFTKFTPRNRPFPPFPTKKQCNASLLDICGQSAWPNDKRVGYSG